MPPNPRLPIVTKRIERKLDADVNKLQTLLQRIELNRQEYAVFEANPLEALQKAGIDVESYARPGVSLELMATEIRGFVQLERNREYWSIFEKIKARMECSSDRQTEEGTNANFDHSTRSEIRFESMTSTERGTSSEKTTGTYTGCKRDFSGLSLTQIDEIVYGPLISAAAMEVMRSKIKATLKERIIA
ncbi:MAG: hypothetical protein MUD01_13510 [Chloroflexaceae bacterium]|jgi:hypothetical protein|nr:hypothetical protein [Chloroflexaceae bacterium]